MDIKTHKEDGCYTLSIVFDNNHVVVYGFPTLKEFVIGYTKFMNEYRG